MDESVHIVFEQAFMINFKTIMKRHILQKFQAVIDLYNG